MILHTHVLYILMWWSCKHVYKTLHNIFINNFRDINFRDFNFSSVFDYINRNKIMIPENPFKQRMILETKSIRRRKTREDKFEFPLL